MPSCSGLPRMPPASGTASWRGTNGLARTPSRIEEPYPQIELSFHGADPDVTGPCHRLQCAGPHLLIDCVMSHAGRELEDDNTPPLAADAAHIDFLPPPHAH